jgi:hypothetical protein
MPPLSILALRYVAWLIGLRFVFILMVQFAGFPNSEATAVILAAAPLADIGMQAVKRASRGLRLPDWALIWGLCLSIFVAVQVILPAILLAPMRAFLADPEGVARTAVIVAATGGMMVVFLWAGCRAQRGPGRPSN